MDHRAPAELSRAWKRAVIAHDAAVTVFTEVAGAIPDDRWHVPRAPGKWSPAEEVLHVVLAYEVALRGLRTGAAMRSRVSPLRARILRWLVLPVIVNTGWFPRAKAPVEVRPAQAGATEAELSRETLLGRLDARAREVRDELPHARPGLRFHHAYFGDLAPRQATRMLAAHTQHHARTVGARC